ncbi:MAG: phage portal protein family protein, partial [Coriobacteriia bacterium]
EIPLEKCLLFRTTTRKDNPEGVSVLRKAYREWYFKRHLESIEGIGAERDLAGLPVMYVPAEMLREDASPQDKELIEYCKGLVTSIRRDEQEGLVLPGDNDPESGKPMFRIELLSTGGQRQFDTDKIITRKEVRMAMTMLADFLFLGQNKVGSFALSSDKTEMFSFALGAWMDGICEVVNPAIRKLLRLNGWKPVKAPPRLYHGDIETVDPKAWSEFLNNIATAGGPLTPEIFAHIYEKVGLPVPEGGLGA